MADVELGILTGYWERVTQWLKGEVADEPLVDVSDRAERELGNVTLTGSNADIITLLDAQAITDTTVRVTPGISVQDIAKYKKVDVWIETTINKTLQFLLLRDVSGTSQTNAYAYLDSTIDAWNTPIVTFPHSTFYRYVRLTSHPAFSGLTEAGPLFKGLRVRYQAAEAPSSGALSIIVVGVPN